MSDQRSSVYREEEFLIEISHNTIGFLAVEMGVARWLELRLPEEARRIPAIAWTTCMILLGAVLLFYREP